MKMTPSELHAEANCLLAAAYAKRLLERGALTESEYASVCAALRRRFRPLLAALLSGEAPEQQ
ncbi:MAG: hypothetical protein IJL83_01775 [Clostridia bacterium]|nr:hypothetical protein [Clostridia bacterium]MBQ6552337.1 hypothetical protein [Clostridia bacterium]